MPKFEAKREILQKFGKTGGLHLPQPPGSAVHDIYIDDVKVKPKGLRTLSTLPRKQKL